MQSHFSISLHSLAATIICDYNFFGKLNKKSSIANYLQSVEVNEDDKDDEDKWRKKKNLEAKYQVARCSMTGWLTITLAIELLKHQMHN